MNFAPTATQESLGERARRFVAEQLAPRRDLDDHEPPHAVYQAAFDAGLFGLVLPTAVGGEGHRPLDLVLAAEELGYGDLGVATSVLVTTLATGPLRLFGTPDQQARWLTPLAEKLRFTSFGWTEPDGSSNLVGRPATTVAVPVDGGYRLTGVKSTITNAPVASFASVFARVEGTAGLTCLIVDTTGPGVRRLAPYKKLGQRASYTGELHFDDVFVPHADQVGRPSQGLQIATRCFAQSRAGIGAMAVGVARRARDLIVEHGHRRRTGSGRPLIEQQDYAFRVAALETEIEATRMLTWRALWELDHGPAGVRLSSQAKLKGGELAVAATGQAVEMLGAHGFLEGGLAEKLYRDAKALQIYEGPPPVQKMLIAETATRRSRVGKR